MQSKKLLKQNCRLILGCKRCEFEDDETTAVECVECNDKNADVYDSGESESFCKCNHPYGTMTTVQYDAYNDAWDEAQSAARTSGAVEL